MLLVRSKIVFFREIHVFLQLNWIDLFGTQRDYLHLENRKMQKYAFQKLIQFSQGNTVLDAPTSNADGFVSKDTCVFSRCWTDLGRTKFAFLHLEYSGWQHVFLSKTTWNHTGKQCAPWFCFEHTWFSLETYMWFFNWDEKVYLEQTEFITDLKYVICRQCPLKNELSSHSVPMF
jgi:hypothetical protein